MSFRGAELPLPVPADGEVLVRLEAATICGSDRHTVSGRRQEACPSILGHEGVGRVQDSRRAGLAVGERVVFSVVSSCGQCTRCGRGLISKCESVRKVGHEGLEGSWPLSGTYASHLLVQAGQTLAPVPEQLPSAIAATAGCAVATVMAALERAGDLRERRVLVSGVGMLGVMALASAQAAGAEHLIASDPDPCARELASGLADEVVAPGPVRARRPGRRHRARVVWSLRRGGRLPRRAGRGRHRGPGGHRHPGPRGASGPRAPGARSAHRHRCAQLRAAPPARRSRLPHRAGSQLPWDRLLGPPVGLADLPAAFEVPDGAPRTPVML